MNFPTQPDPTQPNPTQPMIEIERLYVYKFYIKINFLALPSIVLNIDSSSLYSFLQLNIFPILMSKTSVSEFPGNLSYSYFF